MIISILGEKGGTGKTTISSQIAPLIDDLLIVDTDPQGSISMWGAIRSKNTDIKRVPTIQKFGADLSNEVKELSNRYQNILIDVAGRDSNELRAAMLVSDKVIFPLMPSQFDVWTISNLKNLIKEARSFNNKLEPFFVLNRCPTNDQYKERDEAKALLSDAPGIRLLSSIISDRKVYRLAPSLGLSAIESKPEDKKASGEIMSLYREIYKGHN